MKTTWVLLAALVVGAAAARAKADQYSMMATISPPASDEITDGPTNSYELGTKFQTDVAGQIVALRFWEPQLETGEHVGHLWTGTGTSLATVPFATVSPGWNQATLTTPVNIVANTTYVVSVNSNVYYPDTDQGLASSLVSGPLHSVVGVNGIYDDSGVLGTFPTKEFDNSNYYRDVVFQTAVSTPEPASIGTLALAGLLLLRRRRFPA